MSSVYESEHVLLHANTHKHKTHTYGIHNALSKHKQPEETVRNEMNLNDSHCKFVIKKSNIILPVRI